MTITNKQDEFIQSLEGDITPEQAAQLLEMGEGDTGDPEPGSEPDATSTEQGDDQKAAAAENEQQKMTEGDGDGQGEGEPDPENAVILAKDGKHTIPYDKLVEARERAKAAEARAAEVESKLAEYQQAAEQRKAEGEAPTEADTNAAVAQAAIDQGVDPEIFGDFSEEALAAGIQKLVDLRVQAKVEQLVSEKLAPLQQKAAQESASAHLQAIYEAHPDADSIVESKELADWMGSQPSFVQQAMQQVLQEGSTQEVIELFDQFKKATGTTQAAQAPAHADVKAAAKRVIASAKPDIPNSLTDLQGGKPGSTTLDEAMSNMDGADLLEAMAEMPPEKIEQFLNRRL